MPVIRASEHGTSWRSPLAGKPSRWQRAFAGEERELGAVRRWLRSLLPECPARSDLALVVTELGANAVRHTASGDGGKFSVTLIWSESVIRVAVADSGAPDGPRFVADPEGEDGRGLLVVQGLSSRMGVRGNRRGRLVWAEIPWPGGVSDSPASDAKLTVDDDPATSRWRLRTRLGRLRPQGRSPSASTG